MAQSVAAVSLDEEGHPQRAKLDQLPGFTRKAIANWASAALSTGSTVLSDGLAFCAGVTDAGGAHQPTVAGRRKPRELPLFLWVSTVLGNVETEPSGAYHPFAFGKYAERYLGEVTYRFDRCFDLRALPRRLLVDAVGSGPHPEAVDSES